MREFVGAFGPFVMCSVCGVMVWSALGMTEAGFSWGAAVFTGLLAIVVAIQGK